MITVHTDGAVNNKTQKTGIGVVILAEENYQQISVPVEGNWNNHEAEFIAVNYALNYLVDHNLTEGIVLLKTDSKIVADSVSNAYVKNKAFKDFLERIMKLKENFAFLEVKWIPERENKGADNLAKQALLKS